MSEATYTAELAKSGRSKCKLCKEQIEKGVIKIVVAYPPKDDMAYGISSSYHLTCFKIPRKFNQGGNKCSPSDFVGEHLLDGTPDQDLDQEEVIQKLTVAQTPKKKKKKKDGDDNDDNNIMSRLKRAAKDEDDDDEKEPASKKAKIESKEEDFQEMLRLYRTYAKMNVPELKDFLGWNKQIKAGTKNFVLFKVLDGVLHGRLSVCPLCGASLKFMDGDYDTIHCPGDWDETINQRIPCNFVASRLDSKDNLRDLPFYLSEPTEEQTEEIIKIKEEKNAGSGNEDPVVAELLNEAETLSIDLSSTKGKKKAAEAFAALVDGKLDISSNRNVKLEVGKIIMGSADKSPKEIMEIIVKKFSTIESKAEEAVKKEAAVESVCQNPKNAALILAFQECSTYYFKEGNRNAGATYVKAVKALTDLVDEVTVENAMSFSKGKTKLAGIGKGSAEKMREFCEKGTFEKLEEKRAAHA